MDENVNVVIADENISSLNFLTTVVEDLKNMLLVGACKDEKALIDILKKKEPDIVFLSRSLFENNRETGITEIANQFPEIQIVILSKKTEPGSKKSYLKLGASHFIQKPDLGQVASIQQFSSSIRAVAKSIIRRRTLKTTGRKAIASPKPVSGKNIPLGKKPNAVIPRGIKAVAIAISSGGPDALMEVIPYLPAVMEVPVLLVQHLPDFATPNLVKRIAKKSKIVIHAAVDGELVLPGKVYLAPGGEHMAIKKDDQGKLVIVINQDPPVNNVRPSADVMYASLAQYIGGPVLAVVMTGMGNDGLMGVSKLKEKACYCITQSAETCAVYGMPKMVDDAGMSDEVVPLRSIAKRIVEILKVSKSGGSKK